MTRRIPERGDSLVTDEDKTMTMKKRAYLIAEKPSLEREIKAAYKQIADSLDYEIDFTAQRGHLLTLYKPDEMDPQLRKWQWATLPIAPEEHGGWRYNVRKEKKEGKFLTSQERFDEIKTALTSGKYDFVISAGDPDVEGHLLVSIVLDQIGWTGKVLRFWSNDLTPTAIQNELRNLHDASDPFFVNLYKSGLCRQHSDWRIGMNLSRAATLQFGGPNAKCAIGRVKTPILAIVCRREDEINAFKSATSYGVGITCADGNESFEATLFNPKDESGNEEEENDEKAGIIWYDTKQEAEDVISSIGPEAAVTSVVRKHSKKYADKLYKLATLQSEAGNRYGYTADAVLASCQSLYEKKFASYPRTSSEHLASGEEFNEILAALKGIEEYEPFVKGISTADIARVKNTKKWVDDEKIKTEGHTALRPTKIIPNLSELSETDRNIYMMISRRFLSIFLPPQEFDETTVITESGDYSFKTTGKIITAKGFTELYSSGSSSYTVLPDLAEGEILPITDKKCKPKTTQKPKRYSDGDLIAVCENPLKMLDDQDLKHLGKELVIGTPATRSGIIKELIESDHYMERVKEGKLERIRPTELGMSLIRNLNGISVTKVDMTGQWEEKLQLIRSGELSYEKAEQDMIDATVAMVEEIKALKVVAQMTGNGEVLPANYGKVIGRCGKCGKDLVVGKTSYYCRGFLKKTCNVGVHFTLYNITISEKDAVALLQDGAALKKNFIELKMNPTTGRVSEVRTPTDYTCPCCNAKNMSESALRIVCTCGLTVYKNISGHHLTKNEITDILSKGKTTAPVSFTSTKFKGTYKKYLKLDTEKKQLQFEDIDADQRGDSAECEYACPSCKKHLQADSIYYFCTDCNIKFKKVWCGYALTEKDLADLCSKQHMTDYLPMQSKKHTTFNAAILYHPKTKRMELKFEPRKKKG